MRVPKEILNIIVSHLPISKIFELWCTGRELHDIFVESNIQLVGFIH